MTRWESVPLYRTTCGPVKVSTVKLTRGDAVRFETALIGLGRLEVVAESETPAAAREAHALQVERLQS